MQLQTVQSVKRENPAKKRKSGPIILEKSFNML